MEPLLFEETVRHFSPASLRTILREILCQGKNPTEAYLDRAENFLKSNEQSERNEALGRIWNECYRLLLKTDVVKAMKESERLELRWLLCQVEAFLSADDIEWRLREAMYYEIDVLMERGPSELTKPLKQMQKRLIKTKEERERLI